MNAGKLAIGLTIALAGAAVSAAEMPSPEEAFEKALLVRDNPQSADKEMTAAWETICGQARTGYGAWGTIWMHEYRDNWSDEKVARYKAEFVKSLDVFRKRFPKRAYIHECAGWYWLQHGETSGDPADYDRALDGFRAAIAVSSATSGDIHRYAGLLWGEANALYAKGDVKGTLEKLREFQEKNLKIAWVRRFMRPYPALVSDAITVLTQDPLDALKLPHSVDARAFPHPQECAYEEAFVPVPSLRLKLRGIAADDPRLRLLKVKYARYGIALEDGAEYALEIEVDPATKAFADLRDPAVFAKVKAKKREGAKGEDKSPDAFCDFMENEAYVLTVAEKGAKIVAKTKQGALWGLVSLIQMTDREKKAIRRARLRDWPDVEKRGYLGGYWPSCLEYTLFQKMNSAAPQHHPCDDDNFEPLSWKMESELGHQFHDFGLELFMGMHWMTMSPGMPLAHPRTLPYHTSLCRRYAKEHIGVYFPLDDSRFPLPEADLKKFGSAAAIDGKHQSAIYHAVIKDHPDWRMIVCPPFYWGPVGRSNMYPEARDPYLEQWRKDLDPAIESYWTGPMVKSYGIGMGDADWALKSYGRRPYLFQNAMGLHNLYDYTLDQTDWPSLYAKDVLSKGLRGYHLNGHMPMCCAQVGTLADALWNLGGYRMRRSAEMSAAQLMGPGMFAILARAWDSLVYFDVYPYGQVNDRVLAEDPDETRRRIDDIDSAWNDAQEYAKKEGVPIYGAWGQGRTWAHQIAKEILNPPDFRKKYAAQLKDCEAVALYETKYDVKHRGDTYLSPADLDGGIIGLLKSNPNGKAEKGRLCRQLDGKNGSERKSRLTGRFGCESFPPMVDHYTMCVCGNENAPESSLRLEVNGKTVFDGKVKFPGGKSFKCAKIKIPAKALKRSNVFTLVNTGAYGSKDIRASLPLKIAYIVVLTGEEPQASMDDI